MKLLLGLLLGFPIAGSLNTLTVKSDAVKVTFLTDMQKTEGSIGGFEAKINFDQDDLMNSSIEGSVAVNTIQTGVEKRDAHLKSVDYLEAEKYPKMTFKSGSIKQSGDKFIMEGKLKIKDVERTESITFSYTNKVFKGEGTIQAANYKFGYEKKKPEKTNIKISFLVPVE